MAPIVAHGKGETLDTCLISGNGRKSIFDISSFASLRIYGTNVAVECRDEICPQKGMCESDLCQQKKTFLQTRENGNKVTTR